MKKKKRLFQTFLNSWERHLLLWTACLRTTLAASYKFWCSPFPFSFVSRYIFMYFFISSLPHWLFSSMLFNLYIFSNLPVFFMLFILVSRASLVAQMVKNCISGRRPGFEIPWRREWEPTAVYLPRKSHGQRSLVGYSPRGYKELDMTEQLTLSLSYHCGWRKCLIWFQSS